jgi:demethylspheroidene O-methyltransferase
MLSATLGWRDRLGDWRNRLLANPRFRDRASRFFGTRPVARRRAAELFDLVAGFVYSQWLAACVELDLFEVLHRTPLTAAELAVRGRMPLQSAERLLQAASALGLVEPRGLASSGAPRYALGRLGVAMVGNVAVVEMVRHHRALYADLQDPLALLRRGRGGGELSRYWAYAESDAAHELPPEQITTYSALMAASQPLVAGQVLDAYPIARHRRLLDVGGGEGVFVAEALARAPALVAAVFDLPAVADAARARFARLGLAARAQAVGGNFHQSQLPPGADVVSLIRVIYDHDDEPALAILRAARSALQPGGTLLLAEPMAGTAGAERMGAAYFGLYLLAMGSGRSRTAGELTALLRAAGFGRVQQRATDMPRCELRVRWPAKPRVNPCCFGQAERKQRLTPASVCLR